MAQHTFGGGLSLLLRKQEFVERAVHPRHFLQALVGDKVDRVERAVQNLQAAQVAMIVKEISEETGCHFRAFCAAAGCNFGHRRVQTGGREFSIFLDHPLHTVAFGTVDQRIL